MAWLDKEKFRGKRLLIIDDNPAQLQEYAEEMRRFGFETQTWLMNRQNDNRAFGADRIFHDAKDFSGLVDANMFDALLTDMQMSKDPPFTGLDAIGIVKAKKPSVICALHSGQYRELNTLELGYGNKKLELDDIDVKAKGGIGAFSKSDYPAIVTAFETAFMAQQPTRTA